MKYYKFDIILKYKLQHSLPKYLFNLIKYSYSVLFV